MNYKQLIFLLLLIGVVGQGLAQNFKTHAVAKGETLMAIARRYGVDVKTILANNKELTRPEDLRENTILIIPMRLPKPELRNLA